MNYRMTRKEVVAAMKSCDYILLYHAGDCMYYAHNCKIAGFKKFAGEITNDKTHWSGFKPCSFQEYITKKIGFSDDLKTKQAN